MAKYKIIATACRWKQDIPYLDLDYKTVEVKSGETFSVADRTINNLLHSTAAVVLDGLTDEAVEDIKNGNVDINFELLVCSRRYAGMRWMPYGSVWAADMLHHAKTRGGSNGSSD